MLAAIASFHLSDFLALLRSARLPQCRFKCSPSPGGLENPRAVVATVDHMIQPLTALDSQLARHHSNHPGSGAFSQILYLNSDPFFSPSGHALQAIRSAGVALPNSFVPLD